MIQLLFCLSIVREDWTLTWNLVFQSLSLALVTFLSPGNTCFMGCWSVVFDFLSRSMHLLGLVLDRHSSRCLFTGKVSGRPPRSRTRRDQSPIRVGRPGPWPKWLPGNRSHVWWSASATGRPPRRSSEHGEVGLESWEGLAPFL